MHKFWVCVFLLFLFVLYFDCLQAQSVNITEKKLKWKLFLIKSFLNLRPKTIGDNNTIPSATA